MKKTNKPRAIIFGNNEKIWWDNIIEAILYSKLYNIWHNIKKDGKCITTIHYNNKEICV